MRILFTDICDISNEEQHTNPRTLSYGINLAHLLGYMDIPHEAWNTGAYQPTLNGITQFPMESFCKTLFSHNIDTGEAYFLYFFFILLHKFVSIISSEIMNVLIGIIVATNPSYSEGLSASYAIFLSVCISQNQWPVP